MRRRVSGHSGVSGLSANSSVYITHQTDASSGQQLLVPLNGQQNGGSSSSRTNNNSNLAVQPPPKVGRSVSAQFQENEDPETTQSLTASRTEETIAEPVHS
ncbi:hypothetical protein PoB_000191800 [Plakobranchus ocellatus]|uniref:Uncharacterized protein n=1 Tax=Plakobranchus ocellatus TaxID=259542 RepID=A0AAV3XZL2_9GAST|nr:hypothetical protein PoB_000191800 [Plakobranchus ocellatus]